MMEEGWVKLYRKMVGWEWYSSPTVFVTFLHLLLKANYKENRWQGKVVGVGQVVTSIKSLSVDTGLTARQLRTALSKLVNTHEISIKTTNKYTIVTITNYESYQCVECDERQSKDNQKTIKRQSKDNTIRIKERKNLKNGILGEPSTQFDFSRSLAEAGVPDDLIADFMLVRKKTGGVNTKIAFNALVREAKNAGLEVKDAVRVCIEKSWRSFSATYYFNSINRNKNHGNNQRRESGISSFANADDLTF